MKKVIVLGTIFALMLTAGIGPQYFIRGPINNPVIVARDKKLVVTIKNGSDDKWIKVESQLRNVTVAVSNQSLVKATEAETLLYKDPKMISSVLERQSVVSIKIYVPNERLGKMWLNLIRDASDKIDNPLPTIE